MVDQGFGPPHGCWCDACQQLFQAQNGRSLPQGVNWEDEDWDRMLQFRYQTSDRFEKMLTEHVRQLDPVAYDRIISDKSLGEHGIGDFHEPT